MTLETPPMRLIWPQWQGASPEVVAALTPELAFSSAQLAYHLGSRLLGWLAPPTAGQEVVVPVSTHQHDLAVTDGVFAREVLVEQLITARDLIASHAPERILTLGGECSVSVAPFAYLAEKYGDDLAVIWIDAHPDTGMPSCNYDGYHAMAVSHLLGHGAPEIVSALPATVSPQRVALAALHVWEPDQEPFFTEWGLSTFSPDDLRTTSSPVVDWLRQSGCSKVAIHLDVDAVDSNEVVLGLGAEPNGLGSEEVMRLIHDLSQSAEVVGMTVAEYVPRQVITMRELLMRLPLVQ